VYYAKNAKESCLGKDYICLITTQYFVLRVWRGGVGGMLAFGLKDMGSNLGG
jgi:hypothetical protein